MKVFLAAPLLSPILPYEISVYKLNHIFTYRKTVESIVVSEGPAVQGIYQQVIREDPDLIGGIWESKRRR